MLQSHQAAKLIKTKWFHPGSNWGSFACEANGLANFPMEPVVMIMHDQSPYTHIITTDSVRLCSQSAAMSRPWVTRWAEAHHLAAATAAEGVEEPFGKGWGKGCCRMRMGWVGEQRVRDWALRLGTDFGCGGGAAAAESRTFVSNRC